MNTDPTLIGLKVKLDRPIDRERRCCNGIAIIRPGKARHAGELRCAGCGQHRGWLSHATRDFILETIRRFGTSSSPIIITRQQEKVMSNFEHKPGRGSAFKNEKSTKDTDPRYTGSFKTLDGTDCWLSIFVSETKAGKKYLSISIRPKAEVAVDKSKPIGEALQDQIPF
jgi:hypothetical protein